MTANDGSKMLNQMWQDANKMFYDIDGRINDLYNMHSPVGFSPNETKNARVMTDNDIAQVKDRIAQLRDKTQSLQDYFKQVQASGALTAEKQTFHRKRIETLFSNIERLPLNLERAQRNYNRKKETEVYKRSGSMNTGKFNELQRNEQSIDNSIKIASEIEGYKNSIISSLSLQEETLKRVRLRTMQMFNSLGMSESIVMLIERRSRADMIIFCCLVVFTLLIIYGLCQYKWGAPASSDLDENSLT